MKSALVVKKACPKKTFILKQEKIEFVIHVKENKASLIP
tara:strand:+ start:1040 stop:1156 length:117 start_codon:yes stop_codon:yes gene_type:complete